MNQLYAFSNDDGHVKSTYIAAPARFGAPNVTLGVSTAVADPEGAREEEINHK